MSENSLPPNHYRYRDTILTVRAPKDHVDQVVDSFEFKESDIVLVTYPRSGTLLTQEIIWHIKNKSRIKMNENYGSLNIRFPYIEFHVPSFTPINSIHHLDSQVNEEFRLIKSHLPRNVIFDRIKHCQHIVIVYRDPKDVAVSLFNFYQSFKEYEGWPSSWAEFFDYFVNGRVMYGSYFDWNKNWLAQKHLPNLHIIKYENLAANKAGEIRRLAEFLNESDITEDQINIILENTSVKTMANNPQLNFQLENGRTLIRKGIVGDCKNYFNKEQEQLIDSMTNDFIKPLE